MGEKQRANKASNIFRRNRWQILQGAVIATFMIGMAHILTHEDHILMGLSHSHAVLLYSLIILALSGGFFWAQYQLKQKISQLYQERDQARELSSKLSSFKKAINAHAIVSITDPQGRITYANDLFCSISKYSREELIGRTHSVLNSGTHPTSFFGSLYKTVKSGKPWSAEICNKAKDGSFYWVATTIMPILDPDGKLEEMISIRTNITDIKKKKDELKKSTDLLNATFMNFPGAIVAYNRKLELQLANPAFYELLGVPEDRFPVGSNYADIIRYRVESGNLVNPYGNDPESFITSQIELLQRFQPYQYQRTLHDGRIIDVKGWPMTDGGFVTTHLDVTERQQLIEDLKHKNEETEKSALELQRAQVELLSAHEHLLHALDSMNNGFAIWDDATRLIIANDTFRNFHPAIADKIQPGLLLRDMLEMGVKANVWIIDKETISEKEWVNQIIHSHLNNPYMEMEAPMTNGTQLVVSSKHLNNGNVITTLIDVTSIREREDELRRTRDALKHIAYFDALTTLRNRAHCQQDLEALFRKDSAHKRFALIQIDLDKFKRVNDTMGHAAGDHLLKEIGQRLSFLSSKVSNFKPYRWGGDEFIAIITDADNSEIEGLCQELTDLIAIPVQYESISLWPTVSLGVAVYPDDASDLESLMIYSDLALYKTKEMGRDGYQFFSSDMKEKISGDIRIEADIRSAIEQDQFELYFQPQISTVDESITGIEALLRWNHPERGQLPPGLFMDVVDRYGMASALGRIIFDKAMFAARLWMDEGLSFGRLAINISPAQVLKMTLVDDFFESIDKYKVNPDLLAVELLESILMKDDDNHISELFSRLSSKGVHIELDDFGTGYASLTHLTHLPVDGVKIDRSFVNNIASNEKQQAIVEMVMSMSQLMQLRVVCEGIETYQQLTTVSQISNCSVQGYLVSPPLDLATMTSWIRNKRNIGLLASEEAQQSNNLLPFKTPLI